jgi:hypothetical protein
MKTDEELKLYSNYLFTFLLIIILLAIFIIPLTLAIDMPSIPYLVAGHTSGEAGYVHSNVKLEMNGLLTTVYSENGEYSFQLANAPFYGWREGDVFTITACGKSKQGSAGAGVVSIVNFEGCKEEPATVLVPEVPPTPPEPDYKIVSVIGAFLIVSIGGVLYYFKKLKRKPKALKCKKGGV